jgi:predicted RNase H-like nuclease (RuvC/YqgF family)
MEKKIERLIAIKKPPVKKFNNNPPKKEVPGPTVIPPDTWGKKKQVATDNSETGSSDSESNTQYNAGQLRGQLHPQLQAALGLRESIAAPSQNYQQQFQNYQVRKMYNQQEVAQFGTAETKLKQLQMKLRETEAHRNELKVESQQLKRNLNLVSSGIPPQMADKLD